MDKNILTEKFFKHNPIEEISAQRFLYSIFTREGLEEAVDNFVMEHQLISIDRQEQIKHEIELIQAEHNPDELLRFLRKKIEMTSRTSLRHRVLEFEDVMLPKVTEKLIRSDHEIFIENAIHLLARSKKDYSSQLLNRYVEIRSPYVQSLVCLILGLRGDQAVIPWMMNQYQDMKKMYPDETYAQGPLLALHELKHRFYRK